MTVRISTGSPATESASAMRWSGVMIGVRNRNVLKSVPGTGGAGMGTRCPKPNQVLSMNGTDASQRKVVLISGVASRTYHISSVRTFASA